MSPPARLVMAIYDLDISPLSFDFLHFLSAAYVYADGAPVHVVICPGLRKGWRTKLEAKPLSDADRLWRLDHILIPAARMMGYSITVSPARSLAGAMAPGGEKNPSIFPPGWQPDEPKRCYDFGWAVKVAQTGITVPFRASERAVEHIKPWLAGLTKTGPVVTITLRDTHTPTRNSDRDAWLSVAYHLQNRGYRVVIIPDTEKIMRPIPPMKTGQRWEDILTFCPLAATDLDIRMALYEQAALNMAASGGPFMLNVLSGLPYLWWLLLPEPYADPNWGRTHFVPTAGFMATHNFAPGSQFHSEPNRRVVWEKDNDSMRMLELALEALEAPALKFDDYRYGYPLIERPKHIDTNGLLVKADR